MDQSKEQLNVHVHVHHHGAGFSGTTRLGVCLDRSGSMESIRAATISGFNEWLADQKRLTTDRAVLTMVKFDTEYEFPYVNTPLSNVSPLTMQSFVPRGGTALNDAIAKTIQAIDKELGANQDRAVVLILTDGEENSSREFKTVDSVRALIQGKEATGRWTFVFMRGTLDQQQAVRQAQSYGIQVNNALGYTPDAAGAVAVFASASHGTSNYRSSGVSQTANFFDPAQATSLVIGPAAQALAQSKIADATLGSPQEAPLPEPDPQAQSEAPATETSTPDNTTYTSE